jgi:hypothetical protein
MRLRRGSMRFARFKWFNAAAPRFNATLSQFKRFNATTSRFNALRAVQVV